MEIQKNPPEHFSAIKGLDNPSPVDVQATPIIPDILYPTDSSIIRPQEPAQQEITIPDKYILRIAHNI